MEGYSQCLSVFLNLESIKMSVFLVCFKLHIGTKGTEVQSYIILYWQIIKEEKIESCFFLQVFFFIFSAYKRVKTSCFYWNHSSWEMKWLLGALPENNFPAPACFLG